MSTIDLIKVSYFYCILVVISILYLYRNHIQYFQLAGMIGPIELPFDGCPSNACASMASGDCPTEVGENLVYELDFEVKLLSL